MDTTERMMIMGMCLQGLLANPEVTKGGPCTSTDPAVSERLASYAAKEIVNNIKLAHQYADALDPPAPVTAANQIARLTRIAYEAVRAAHSTGGDGLLSYDDARNSAVEAHVDAVDHVFERVSRWFHDPRGVPDTMTDRIIRAVVAAGRGQDDAPQPDLFG